MSDAPNSGRFYIHQPTPECLRVNGGSPAPQGRITAQQQLKSCAQHDSMNEESWTVSSQNLQLSSFRSRARGKQLFLKANCWVEQIRNLSPKWVLASLILKLFLNCCLDNISFWKDIQESTFFSVSSPMLLFSCSHMYCFRSRIIEVTKCPYYW